MKEDKLIYDISIYLDKFESELLNLVSNVNNKTILNKLFSLLNDLLIFKSEINKSLSCSTNNKNTEIEILVNKYSEYKNLMSLL